MIQKLFAIIIGFFALFFTQTFGVYPIILMLVLIEICSVSKNIVSSNMSILVGMFLCELYFLYTDTGISQLEYFLYIGFYLYIRFKGKEWFIDNKVNGWLYLFFAVSVPTFLDFITQLAEIKLNILMFTTLYLLFLRLSDLVLKSKVTVLLFSISQIISIYSLGNFILHNEMKIYLVVTMIVWTLMKWKTGGVLNVSKIFAGNLFRKSGEGVY